MGVRFKCDGAILFAAAEQVAGNQKIERRRYNRCRKTSADLLQRLWRNQSWHCRPGDTQATSFLPAPDAIGKVAACLSPRSFYLLPCPVDSGLVEVSFPFPDKEFPLWFGNPYRMLPRADADVRKP